MTFEIKKGTAFLVPSGPKGQLHLHIVLTEQCPDGDHLVASISSIKNEGWYDDTCVFDGGEHDFIIKSSFVFYRATTRMSARHIKKMISKKYYKEQTSVSNVVFTAICEGVCESDHTPRASKKYYEENGD